MLINYVDKYVYIGIVLTQIICDNVLITDVFHINT